MNSKILEILEVQNIGPIKEARIETKKINVFIGKNSTGKSIIAKLLQVKREKEDLRDYNLKDFITKDTKIRYKNNNVFKNSNSVFDTFLKFLEKDVSIEFLNKELKNELRDILEKILGNKNSYYIPVERNLVPFLSSYGINLLSSKIPLPQYVVEFATEFRLAKDKVKSSEVLGFKYKFEDDEDKLYVNNENFISLKNASSGIQTLLPLYLTVEYLNLNSTKHYLLEEPELNLFPREQFELIKYMIKNSESVVFITHSPYVLFSLNILIYAHKVGNLNKEAKKLVEDIIPSDYWINPKEFSAYSFEERTVNSFFDNGITDNILDDMSMDLEELMDELREIYLKVKK